jgi:hypothetical protein
MKCITHRIRKRPYHTHIKRTFRNLEIARAENIDWPQPRKVSPTKGLQRFAIWHQNVIPEAARNQPCNSYRQAQSQWIMCDNWHPWDIRQVAQQQIRIRRVLLVEKTVLFSADQKIQRLFFIKSADVHDIKHIGTIQDAASTGQPIPNKILLSLSGAELQRVIKHAAWTQQSKADYVLVVLRHWNIRFWKHVRKNDTDALFQNWDHVMPGRFLLTSLLVAIQTSLGTRKSGAAIFQHQAHARAPMILQRGRSYMASS